MDLKLRRISQNSLFLVTGGAGFIGSNICGCLLEHGYKVRVLDNFLTGKMENIDDFFSNINFEFVEGDIRDLDVCQSVCRGVSYVLHHAALGSVPGSVEDPKTCNEINVDGTLNMMIAARDNNVKRFVYASSSAVYGDDESLPKIESRVGRPLSPYAVSKYVNELYAKNFFDLYGLETVGLRYFNVFGKKQDPDSVYAAVIPLFIAALLKNDKPSIFGDGKQTRDFVYIDNVVNANLLACTANSRVCGEAFNIATGGKMELIELYNIITKLLNKDIEPEMKPERKGDIKHSNADIEKALNDLGYKPAISVEEGLKMSIEWYEEFIGDRMLKLH